jgi:drug/metabolite transporter (DMT)-like permease
LTLALIAIVCGWSFNYIAGKIALRHMNALTLVSFRIELAALILLVIFWARPGRMRFQARDWWTFAVLGFFGVVMNSGLFTVGLSFTTSGHSAIVLACGPILVLLLARAQRLESLTAGKVIGMGLSLAGVIILAGEQGLSFHSQMFAGDFITLIGSCGFALYTVFGKKVADKYDSVVMNTFNNAAGAVLLFPLAVYEGWRLDWKGVGWAGWAGMVYMAAVCSVLTYLLYYWALRYMKASHLATISYFQPLVVVVLGLLFLGEPITKALSAGGGLVLGGVYVTNRSRE